MIRSSAGVRRRSAARAMRVSSVVQPRDEGAWVRVAAQCCPRACGVFVCGQPLAEVEAEVSPAEIEIGAQPARTASEMTDAPGIGQLVRGAVEVAVMDERHRPGRAGDGGNHRVVDPVLDDKRLCLLPPLARLPPRPRIRSGECEVAKTDGSGEGKPGAGAVQHQRLPEGCDGGLRPAEQDVRGTDRAAPGGEPRSLLFALGGVYELSVGEHLVDPAGPESGTDVCKRRSQRGCPVGRRHIEIASLGGEEKPVGLLSFAHDHVHPGGGDRQLRISADLVVRAVEEPQPHRLDVAATQEPDGGAQSDPSRPPEITTLVGTTERLFGVGPLLLVPLRGASEVDSCEPGISPVELGAEQLAEQVVVAVPTAFVVERYDKRVRVLELAEHLPRPGSREYRIAQRRRHPAKNRRREQEDSMLLRLLIQHHLDQIIGNVALRSPEGVCDGVTGGLLARCPQRERDAGRPALGAFADEPRAGSDRFAPVLAARSRVSPESSARLLARTSSTSPSTRRRARGRSGSARVTSTSCDPRGISSSRKLTIARLPGRVNSSRSSRINSNGERRASSSASTGSTTSSTRGAGNESSSNSSSAIRPSRSSACTRELRRTSGLLSPRSRFTQAAGRRHRDRPLCGERSTCRSRPRPRSRRSAHPPMPRAHPAIAVARQQRRADVGTRSFESRISVLVGARRVCDPAVRATPARRPAAARLRPA